MINISVEIKNLENVGLLKHQIININGIRDRHKAIFALCKQNIVKINANIMLFTIAPRNIIHHFFCEKNERHLIIFTPLAINSLNMVSITSTALNINHQYSHHTSQ
jgi:hypothetical protein